VGHPQNTGKGVIMTAQSPELFKPGDCDPKGIIRLVWPLPDDAFSFSFITNTKTYGSFMKKRVTRHRATLL
jgi:hypothetical protein